MQPVMVVVDNNVNARVICEVLLESRGEHCVLCARGEIHECIHRLRSGGVLLPEADLRHQQHRQQLSETVRRLKQQRREVGILVVTDGESELRDTEVAEWANDVLHASQVGAALLPKLDALRANHQLGA